MSASAEKSLLHLESVDTSERGDLSANAASCHSLLQNAVARSNASSLFSLPSIINIGLHSMYVAGCPSAGYGIGATDTSPIVSELEDSLSASQLPVTYVDVIPVAKFSSVSSHPQFLALESIILLSIKS